MPKKGSHVYIMGYKKGPIKIGMSSDPKYRLTGVKNYAKTPMAKVLWTKKHDNADIIEGMSHFYLCNYEAGQEWFFLSLAEAIKAVKKVIKYRY